MINLVKTGLVVSTKGRSAVIMSNSGEFYSVNTAGKKIEIGEELAGTVVINRPFYKNLAAVASLLFFILIGSAIYTYNTPVATVLVNVNPSIQLKTNRYSRIISYAALNSDGSRVLNGISIKNKSMDEGLYLIIKQCKKDNFINDKYVKSGKTIMINITSRDNKQLNISKSEKYILSSGLNAEINNSGAKKQISNEIKKSNVPLPGSIPNVNSNKPSNNIVKGNQGKKHIYNNRGNASKSSSGDSANKSKKEHKAKDNNSKANKNKKH